MTSTKTAHAELLETSLRQERELQQLPPLKRQLEVYKQGTLTPTSCPPFPLDSALFGLGCRWPCLILSTRTTSTHLSPRRRSELTTPSPPPLHLVDAGATESELAMRDLRASLGERDKEVASLKAELETMREVVAMSQVTNTEASLARPDSHYAYHSTDWVSAD